MEYDLPSCTITALTTNGDRYGEIMNSGDAMGSSESAVSTILSIATLFKNLVVNQDTAPGSGISRTLLMRKNSADSALTVTMNNTTTGSDTTHTVSCVAGDAVNVLSRASTTTASSGNIRYAMRAVSTNLNQANIFGGSQANVSNSVTNWFSFSGTGKGTTNGADVESLITTAGTIKNAQISLTNAPTAGSSYQFKLYKNGVATSLVITISDTAVSGSDTNAAHAVTVAVGDTLYWEVIPTNAPSARQITSCVEFNPNVNGEYPLCFGASNVTSANGARFQVPFGNGTYGTTDAARSVVWAGSSILKNFYIKTASAQGAGKTLFFELNKNTDSTGMPTVTLSNQTTNNNTTTNGPIASGDTLSVGVTPTGTPTVTTTLWGFTSYVVPVLTSQFFSGF